MVVDTSGQGSSREKRLWHQPRRAGGQDDGKGHCLGCWQQLRRADGPAASQGTESAGQRAAEGTKCQTPGQSGRLQDGRPVGSLSLIFLFTLEPHFPEQIPREIIKHA